MTDENIIVNTSIDGSDNTTSNTINSNNKTIINIYPDTKDIILTLNVKLTLRYLYGDLRSRGGQLLYYKISFDQELAFNLNLTIEELLEVRSDLFLEGFITGKTSSYDNFTEEGKAVAGWFFKNRPIEYDMERNRIIQLAVKNTISSGMDSFLIPIESDFTEKVVKELEDEQLISKYMSGGVEKDRYLNCEFMRKITPNFKKKFNIQHGPR